MTSIAIPRNAYTDEPELHPNLILGSLQLLFWLFFHPSAWRNHVARTDSDLRPDFCLAELSGEQWRNPALRRLLIIGFVVCPLLVGIAMGLMLWILSGSGWIAADAIAFGMAFGVVLGLAGSVTFSIAGSMVGGVVGSVVIGVALGVSGGMANAIVIGFGLAFGIASGVMGGVVSGTISRGAIYSSARRISGIVISVLTGIVVVIAALFSIASGVTAFAGEHRLRLMGIGVVSGLVIGVAAGWRTHRWRRSMAIGIVGGIAFSTGGGIASNVMDSSIAYSLTRQVVYGVGVGMLFGGLFNAFWGISYVLAERIAGPWAGVVAGALASGWGGAVFFGGGLPVLPPNLVSILLGLTLALWRPVVLYPLLAVWNLLLYRADERRAGGRPSLLRWHSAFWDEHQRLPLLGLEDHLVLVMERNPTEGQIAMEYLATSRQRWAAQAAQIELDAHELERCADVEAIRLAHRSLAAGELAGPASALLRSFSRVSQDVEVALRQESAYNQRLTLSAIEDRLDGLLRELTRSSERYAVRFRPIATLWRQIVADHVRELTEAVEARQEIDSPYVIGVPLTAQQEIFVGRTDVSARIEGLLLDRRRPPLLLYGQRRMGKTSLLNNLGRLLPSTIVPLFVDLQGPASQANDHAGFLYNIARGMIDSASRQRGLALPPLPRETLAADPFTRFDEWLDQVEKALGENTVLLALDEFEALDSAITKGRLDEEAVLGTLRHLIQHRPRFKVLLTGSHILDELQRWASYLINVQVVHISYLKETEARQLIERPVRDFPLRYEPDASQQVLDLTRGHPFLVQLLCAEIVALKNEQDPAVRRLARLADVEAAVPEALARGIFFFVNIQQNQVDAAGLALLRFLAAQGEGTVVSREALAHHFPAELDRTLDLLARRELIEPADGGYRFQVELIRRWFAQR